MSGPRNIGLTSLVRYRFPVTAITSILHRLSGLCLVLLIPFALWGLHCSLSSVNGFALVEHCLKIGWIRFLVWVGLSALSYHVIAGIKHLLMDLGHFETNLSGRWASWFVIVLSAALIVYWGVLLW